MRVRNSAIIASTKLSMHLFISILMMNINFCNISTLQHVFLVCYICRIMKLKFIWRNYFIKGLFYFPAGQKWHMVIWLLTNTLMKTSNHTLYHKWAHVNKHHAYGECRRNKTLHHTVNLLIKRQYKSRHMYNFILYFITIFLFCGQDVPRVRCTLFLFTFLFVVFMSSRKWYLFNWFTAY